MIRISKRDTEKFQIGDQFIYLGNNYDVLDWRKNDIFEVTQIDALDGICLMKNLRNGMSVSRSIRNIVENNLYKKIEKIQPKPHEYSPIEMSGRYRTIGD